MKRIILALILVAIIPITSNAGGSSFSLGISGGNHGSAVSVGFTNTNHGGHRGYSRGHRNVYTNTTVVQRNVYHGNSYQRRSVVHRQEGRRYYVNDCGRDVIVVPASYRSRARHGVYYNY